MSVTESGRLSFSPAGDQAADPDMFLGEVSNVWDRAQRAAQFSANTISSKRARVLDLVEFSGRSSMTTGLAQPVSEDYSA